VGHRELAGRDIVYQSPELVFDRGMDKSKAVATTSFADAHKANSFGRREDSRGHVQPNEAHGLELVAARRSIRPISRSLSAIGL